MAAPPFMCEASHGWHSSLVPSSLPSSSGVLLDDSFIQESPTKESSSRLTSCDSSSLALPAPLTPDSLLSCSTAELPIPSSLSVDVECCAAPVAASVAEEWLLSSSSVAVPDSPPWYLHSASLDADSSLLTDRAIRHFYIAQPRQRADIDPYVLYCSLTDSAQTDQLQPAQPSHCPPSSQCSPFLCSLSTSPDHDVARQKQRLSPSTSLLSPVPRLSPVPPALCDGSPCLSLPAACSLSASLSLDMSYVDLPSQLHRLRDSPTELERKAPSATLSLSYQSATQTLTIHSQHSTLDGSIAGQPAIPFPRLSEGTPVADSAHFATATVHTSVTPAIQPRRRIGAYCVEQSGVLLPNMRSALIPAETNAEITSEVKPAAADSITDHRLHSIASAVLPAASPELRSLHCRMYAILLALTGCGCHPYHVRVLRIASVALESLCERENLFATRDMLAQQIGCTRDVMQWVDVFDLSGHTDRCCKSAKKRLAAQHERAEAEGRRAAAEWQKETFGRDAATSQLNERHSSSFSYPSSECTA